MKPNTKPTPARPDACRITGQLKHSIFRLFHHLYEDLDMNMRTKTLLTALAATTTVALAAGHADAAIVTAINVQAGTAGGVSVDTTGGTYAAWGYATGALVNGFDNTKSGTSAPTFTHNGLTSSNRDFGHRFTFGDGTDPTSGTTVVTDGAAASLPGGGGRTWSFLFEDVVTTTESTLTLYIGGWQSGAVGVNIDATLTGGTADEAGTQQSYDITSDTTSGGINSGVYTVTFSSATETDLLVEFATSNTSTKGSRNIGVSGYTLEVVPEPGSLALLGLSGLCLIKRRRREA